MEVTRPEWADCEAGTAAPGMITFLTPVTSATGTDVLAVSSSPIVSVADDSDPLLGELADIPAAPMGC